MSRAFDGDDYGEAAHDSVFDDTEFAVFAWINTSSTSGNWPVVCGRSSSAASFGGFGIYLDHSSGRPNLSIKSTGGTNVINIYPSGIDYRSGTWRFIGADLRQANGAANRLICGSGSGNRFAANASAAWSFAASLPFRLGLATDAFNSGLIGQMAHAAWVGRCLTDTEWDDLAGGGNPLAVIGATDLAGYWPLAGTTNPEPDDSGNGRTLTMTGTGQGADDPAVDPPPSSNPTSRLAPDAIAASTNLSGVLGNIQESVL